jgi:DNA-binding NarL/FixJ family response regulator
LVTLDKFDSNINIQQLEQPMRNPELMKTSVKPSTLLPVIICDDHIAIRAGLRLILERGSIQVVGECDSVMTLLDLVRLNPNAIVITDLGVDEVQFPNLVSQLRNQSADCQIVVYSMREAPATIGLCYEAGAIAFVPKSADPDEIIKAINRASNGDRYFPASVASELAGLLLDRTSPKALLTARELEIFIGYVREGTVEALAERIGISDKTVQNLLSQIAKKLNSPRSTFHNLAREHGLID